MDVGVRFLADVRLRNVVANKRENRFEEVPEDALRRFASLNLLRERQIYPQDDAGGQEHQNGILGQEFETANLAKRNPEVNTFLEDVPDVGVEHVVERVPGSEKHPHPLTAVPNC